MEGIFFMKDSDYNEGLNPVKAYLDQLTELIKIRKGYSKEESHEKAKLIIRKHFKDKSVKYFQKQENGDKEVENSTLLSYINDNIKNKNILAPTFTSYVNSDVKESVLSKYIVINTKTRSVSKKEAQAAKAAGLTVLATNKNNEQNNLKIKNNSLSGLFAQKGSVVHNTTAHSTLTSVTRTVTSLTNATNERIIGGNRYTPRLQDVLRMIVYEATYIDEAKVRSVVEEFNLHLPTVKEVVDVLKRSSDLYNQDANFYNEKIIPVLEKMSPYQRAGICYTLDLHTLRTYNEEFTKQLLTDLIKKTENTGKKLEDPSVLYTIDEAILYFAHTVYSEEINGMGKDYKVMNEKGIAYCIYQTSLDVIKTLQKYKNFFNCFYMSPIFPINSHRLRNMRRRTVVLSDTDSSGFSIDEWATWWEGGEFKLTSETIALTGGITYLVTSVIVNLLARLSKNLNVEESKLRTLAMKNEYLWSSFIPAEVSKHYFSFTTICEGNVFENPEVEVKGVHLKSSSAPRVVIDESDAIMEYILRNIHENKKMRLTDIVKRMVDVEENIINSLKRGEISYLRLSKIKEASSYAKGPKESPYHRHTLWVDVFSTKYGAIEEPTYDVVKIPTTVVNTTARREWLASIEDVEIAAKLDKWLTEYNKKDLPTIYLHESYAQDNGIPVEILSVLDIRRVVMDVTLSLRTILESLGVVLNPVLLISEQMDLTQEVVKPVIRFSYARLGDGVECSTKGHKEFSPFYAKLPDGETIEHKYQTAIKGYSSISEGKGKPPKDPNTDLWGEYLNLWRIWAEHNPDKITKLKLLASEKNYLLTDMFGWTEVNQARALATILNESIGAE